VIGNVKKRDLLVWMGDFNASTGTSSGEDDTVCGPYGNPHVNDAGRELKSIASMLGLQEVGTFQADNNWEGTWVHPRSKLWYQLDKVFLRTTDVHLLNSCKTANMITDSDHYSVRLNLNLERSKKPCTTLRQKRNGLNFADTFGKNAPPKTTMSAMSLILENFNNLTGNDDHKKLMKSIEKSTSTL
jgi:hypothetical protein